MKVTLKLFAAVRDIVGTSSIEIDPGEGATPADVWRDLTMRHPELGVHRIPMIAINEEYAKEDEVLHDGDELAFIPPVSGG